jgi:hypothetical protein
MSHFNVRQAQVVLVCINRENDCIKKKLSSLTPESTSLATRLRVFVWNMDISRASHGETFVRNEGIEQCPILTVL